MRREYIEWLETSVNCEDDTVSPRILLIGDSISMGYYPKVKAILKEKGIIVDRLATSRGLDDPIILKEFNMLVERYTGYDVDPQTGSVVPRIARMSGDSTIADGLMNNHVSLIPYISQRKGMNELLWKLPPRPQPGAY